MLKNITTFLIPKMDCPCEEQMIRLTLSSFSIFTDIIRSSLKDEIRLNCWLYAIKYYLPLCTLIKICNGTTFIFVLFPVLFCSI